MIALCAAVASAIAFLFSYGDTLEQIKHLILLLIAVEVYYFEYGPDDEQDL